MRNLFLGLAVVLIASAAGLPARAQSVADSLSGFSADSDQPVQIQSDQLEVKDKEKVAVFSGNVEVVQGTTVLRTTELWVTYTGERGEGGQQQIERLEARGKVVVTSEQNTMTGDWAVFEMAEQLITVGGDVVVTQGENVLTGSRLVVDLTTGRSRLEAAATSSGRVQGLFVPKSSNNEQASQ